MLQVYYAPRSMCMSVCYLRVIRGTSESQHKNFTPETRFIPGALDLRRCDVSSQAKRCVNDTLNIHKCNIPRIHWSAPSSFVKILASFPSCCMFLPLCFYPYTRASCSEMST